MSVKSPNYLGKVRSNFLGTEFTIYDRGLNPKKKETYSNPDAIREEYGVILYASNLLGARGPRKMKLILPFVNEEGKMEIWKPKRKNDSMLQRFK